MEIWREFQDPKYQKDAQEVLCKGTWIPALDSAFRASASVVKLHWISELGLGQD
jgi:hypothetical protein